MKKKKLIDDLNLVLSACKIIEGDSEETKTSPLPLPKNYYFIKNENDETVIIKVINKKQLEKEIKLLEQV